jgi:hypothetical protein
VGGGCEWARRIAGAISVGLAPSAATPRVLGERPDATQQASEQIVGTVNATNVSRLVQGGLRAAAAISSLACKSRRMAFGDRTRASRFG